MNKEAIDYIFTNGIVVSNKMLGLVTLVTLRKGRPPVYQKVTPLKKGEYHKLCKNHEAGLNEDREWCEAKAVEILMRIKPDCMPMPKFETVMFVSDDTLLMITSVYAV